MTPCPSPNGTNYERLFLVRTPPEPVMAMDAQINLRAESEPGGHDLEDKIRELLSGKLDDADLETLLQLIQPEADRAPAPGQDVRQLRPARDVRRGMATDELQRRVSAALVRQARTTNAGLIARFPALKNARVV